MLAWSASPKARNEALSWSPAIWSIFRMSTGTRKPARIASSARTPIISMRVQPRRSREADVAFIVLLWGSCNERDFSRRARNLRRIVTRVLVYFLDRVHQGSLRIVSGRPQRVGPEAPLRLPIHVGLDVVHHRLHDVRLLVRRGPRIRRRRQETIHDRPYVHAPGECPFEARAPDVLLVHERDVPCQNLLGVRGVGVV